MIEVVEWPKEFDDHNEGSGGNMVMPQNTETEHDLCTDIIREADSFVDHDGEITAEQLLSMPATEVEYLAEPIFRRSGLVCVGGGSDAGKSALLRQFAIAIVSGEEHFLGFPLKSRHKSALFVATEDSRDDTLAMLRMRPAIDPRQVKGLRFLFSSSIDISKMCQEVERRIKRKPVDAVLIDAFGDAYGADLKDSQKLRAFLHPFQVLAEKYQCLIIFLHHTSKRTEEMPPSKNNLLAGQAFEAKIRLLIELRADPFDPEIRHLCIVKGNYLPSHMKTSSFALKFDEARLHFTNTGDRVPFEMLVKKPLDDETVAKYQQAHALKEQGFTYQQIADQLGYASKGSVTKLFDKANKIGLQPPASATK